MTSLYKLIQKRLKAVRTDRWALADVSYALRKLTEGGAPHGARGRVETLHDLLAQAERAESTQDPAVIKELCDALNAFLDAEIKKAAKVRAKADTESEAGVCECGHSLEGIQPDGGGDVVCPKCGRQTPGSATESDDDEYAPYAPYFPVEDSTEVHSMRRHHRSKKKRTESRAVAAFNRSLRGDDVPRPSHQSPVEAFASMCPIPPRSASPRQPGAAAVRFTRYMDGNPLADRADRLAAAGKSAGSIFSALMER
jgi:hypothetical protein